MSRFNLLLVRAINLKPPLGLLVRVLLTGGLVAAAAAQERAQSVAYRAELNIPYCTVDGTTQVLNAFLPPATGKPVPAMVEIHGGAFQGGGPLGRLDEVPAWRVFASRRIAVFSISYRLAQTGGFPQNIRDCRNAVRFIRKHAARFHIDPNRIGCMGGSAGGHLSLMVAMVPEAFDDGGPSTGLEGVSAKTCGCFSWIPPTDLAALWGQPAAGVSDGGAATPIQSGLRLLFHGVAPDTTAHRELYDRMSPIGQTRKGLPPLLICDGELDPIVPGQQGRKLQEKLQRAGADSSYWMTPASGHAFPGGPGFSNLLERFVERILGIAARPDGSE